MNLGKSEITHDSLAESFEIARNADHVILVSKYTGWKCSGKTYEEALSNYYLALLQTRSKEYGEFLALVADYVKTAPASAGLTIFKKGVAQLVTRYIGKYKKAGLNDESK